MANKPLQKILFGSPGTGKSYKINTEYLKELEIQKGSSDHIPTVFHPEYTYGDFMGKLMPLSKLGEGVRKVEYHYYTGHFLKALGRAYKNIITSHRKYENDKKELWENFRKSNSGITKKNLNDADNREIREKFETLEAEIKREKPKDVILIIDEINRGNSAAIFGTVFQLLDRDKNGWSSYSITFSDLEHYGLEKEIGFEHEKKFDKTWYDVITFDEEKEITKDRYNQLLEYIFSDLEDKDLLKDMKIKIPPNLHIVATMNTSDNSIYFMDNAFKRRWDWEFVRPDLLSTTWEKMDKNIKERKVVIYGEEVGLWYVFKKNLNKYIKSKYKTIRKIDDKQIGYFFIDEDEITEKHVKSKLLFFLWDSVFPNNKKPLVELLWGKENVKDNEHKLVSFGQLSSKANVKNFVDKIVNKDF
jgi:5-methylcytosine-specific restriction protein B